jgi:hypothetical protein
MIQGDFGASGVPELIAKTVRRVTRAISGRSLPITAELLIGPKYRKSKEATTFLVPEKDLAVGERSAAVPSRQWTALPVHQQGSCSHSVIDDDDARHGAPLLSEKECGRLARSIGGSSVRGRLGISDCAHVQGRTPRRIYGCTNEIIKLLIADAQTDVRMSLGHHRPSARLQSWRWRHPIANGARRRSHRRCSRVVGAGSARSVSDRPRSETIPR